MRVKTSKIVAVAGLCAALALLMAAIAFRFAQTSVATSDYGASEVTEGHSARFGASRERGSSYVSTLALGTGTFDGEVYRFDGDSICIETLCGADGNGAEPAPTFSVELIRLDFGLVEVPMGSRRLASRGLTSAAWENVGPGEYFFRFAKADDGCVLTSTNVWKYSFKGE